MKAVTLTTLCIAFLIAGSACSTSNIDTPENVFKDQIGTLAWKGSPVVDGVGMLFIVDGIEYGVSGTPDDFRNYLVEDTYEARIKADFFLTGNETVRGWGATFPEIKFIKIEKL